MNLLESQKITKTYGAKAAVREMTLALEAGHIYALLGPNGSGKTTWMKMATGLIKPTSGAMLYRGRPVGRQSRGETAYMSTEPFFYPWMRVSDVGAYYADFFADFSPARYGELLRRMDLAPEMKTRALSSGMMAKLKIAATLARRAKVYLLDEPFNGIDLISRDQILQTVLEAAQEDSVLLLSSHLVEEMETVVDRAAFMKEGRLIEVREVDEMRGAAGVSLAQRYREIFSEQKEA